MLENTGNFNIQWWTNNPRKIPNKIRNDTSRGGSQLNLTNEWKKLRKKNNYFNKLTFLQGNDMKINNRIILKNH